MASRCLLILDCKYCASVQKNTTDMFSFLIMWSTWFQITIFDVRFAGNSVFERICKLYQFIAFVIFAAVGTTFNPGGEGSDKNYRIYQLMAVILGITRFVLAIQYSITAYYVVPLYKKLLLPFLLLIFTFVISGAGLLAVSTTTTDKPYRNRANSLLDVRHVCSQIHHSGTYRLVGYHTYRSHRHGLDLIALENAEFQGDPHERTLIPLDNDYHWRGCDWCLQDCGISLANNSGSNGRKHYNHFEYCRPFGKILTSSNWNPTNSCSSYSGKPILTTIHTAITEP